MAKIKGSNPFGPIGIDCMIWILFGLLAALTYGISPVVTRYVMKDKKMCAYPFSAIFQTMTTIMLIALAILLGETTISEKIIIAALIGSPLVYIAGLLWTIASRYEESSYIGTLLRFDSVVMAFVGVAFLGEVLGLTSIVGGLLILSGVYYIAKKAKSGNTSPIALKLIAGTIVFGVLWNLSVKLGVGKNTAIMFSVLFFFFRSIISWTVTLIFKKKETKVFIEKILENKKYLTAVFIRALFAASGILGLSYGYLTGTFAEIGIITATAPLFTVILSGKVLKESNIKIKLVSAMIIVAGTLLLVM